MSTNRGLEEQIDSTAVGNVVIQDGRIVAQGAITAMKSNG